MIAPTLFSTGRSWPKNSASLEAISTGAVWTPPLCPVFLKSTNFRKARQRAYVNKDHRGKTSLSARENETEYAKKKCAN